MGSYQRVSSTELQDLNHLDIDLEAQTHSPLLNNHSTNTNKLTSDDNEDPDDVREVDSDFDQELCIHESSSSALPNDTTSSSSSSNNNNNSQQRGQTAPFITGSTLVDRGNSVLRTLSTYFNYLDRYNTHPSSSHTYGSGSQNDGVFRNLSAKPDLQPAHTSDLPPTYIEASSDTSPPYWESTLLNPNGSGFGDEIFIDGLPVGNIVNFIWNALVSISFQYVGFVLTFVLHTSHAAKEGSKFGLGGTFVMFGWAALPQWSGVYSVESKSKLKDLRIQPASEVQNAYEGVDLRTEITGTVDEFTSSLSEVSAQAMEALGSSEQFSWKMWLGAVGLMLFGLWIIYGAVKGYLRAREMERVILMPPQEVNIHPEPEQEQARGSSQTAAAEHQTAN